MTARRWCALAALGAALALAGCGGDSEPESQAAARGGNGTEIADLDNVLGLRAAFNDDRGLPRLVLLLSPT